MWPGDATFALFLSHDVDQIFDRGVYRSLADANHLRKVLSGEEQGSARECVRRLGRAIFAPKNPEPQFEEIIEMEQRHGWRSTFFVLEGENLARYGSRYRLEDPRVQGIARSILDAGCEIGVHGGYYDFNSASGYRRSADRVEAAFGVRPVGIRNHYLRLSIPETWRAQAEAGYVYDATFGWADRPGPRDDCWFPFEADTGTGVSGNRIVVLPLAIMDTTLFRYSNLAPEASLAAAIRVVERAAASGGLLTLLWHNNYFDEPEYRDWQEVYRALLAHIADLHPWCATGAEIAAFWRTRGR